MSNLLLQDVEYQVTETPFGIWRRYLYPSGQMFAEYVTHAKFYNWRLVHITWGVCPETGKRIMARGVVAVGRRAFGFVAVGQVAVGVIAIGQLAIGLLFGFGQAATGVVSIGQAALGLAFGLGQAATGFVAVGQFAFGCFVLAQLGYGTFVWDTRGVDPVARQFFKMLLP